MTLPLVLLGCSSDDPPGGATGPDGGNPSAAGGVSAAGAGGRPSGQAGSGAGTSGGGGSPGGAGSSGGGKTTAATMAAKIGRSHFLIGLGNDLNDDHDRDGAYTLGPTLDVHYGYLSRYKDSGGWPDWNANGEFVNILTDSAKRHGVVPMFTLYEMAGGGEGNAKTLVDDGYMKLFWADVKLLYQRIGAFGDPTLVQFEPDFWGSMQQASGSNPASLPAHVGTLSPDCAAQPETLAGMGKCLVLLGRKYAPKALLAFHASSWADPDPAKIATFLVALGADGTDFVTTDMLDRDAGCFEAHVDPNCQRGDGPWYWDETNQSSPNFHENLAWAKTVVDGMSKPMVWWQTPLGVPSTKPGGTAGKYRDNRVKYVFEHIDEFVAAGGLGVVFGTGAGNQTYIDSDGGQFKAAVTKYFAAPVALP